MWEGMVSLAKKGNGLLRVELSIWRTWRVSFRSLFSIWTMFSDAEERVCVFLFGRIFVVLSCCRLLLQPCSSGGKQTPLAIMQAGTVYIHSRVSSLWNLCCTNMWDTDTVMRFYKHNNHVDSDSFYCFVNALVHIGIEMNPWPQGWNPDLQL